MAQVMYQSKILLFVDSIAIKSVAERTMAERWGLWTKGYMDELVYVYRTYIERHLIINIWHK